MPSRMMFFFGVFSGHPHSSKIRKTRFFHHHTRSGCPGFPKAVGSGYWYVIGEVDDMIEIAKRLGQAWLKGVGFAARLAGGE
ncbi:MAG: hypothetical protein HOP03_02490 [Lysobacter sp.]|nr:hypothetical protein [Lysobacter sp.]